MRDLIPHDIDEEVQRPRKSPWHLVFVPMAFAVGAGFCYASVQVVCWMAGRWSNGGGSFGSLPEHTKIFVILSLLFASIPIGFLATNLMIWSVPPLRRFFIREAQEREGRSFWVANQGLLKVAGIVEDRLRHFLPRLPHPRYSTQCSSGEPYLPKWTTAFRLIYLGHGST